jgi:hypothetical protein
VADELGLAAIAPGFDHAVGVGRVIGAAPRDGAACDVQLAMIFRVNDRFRLRRVVIGIERLAWTREDFFTPVGPSSDAFEDLDLPTLDDALQAAPNRSEGSPAVPIAGQATWLPSGQFLENMKGSLLATQLPWLPKPPLRPRIAKSSRKWGGSVVGALVCGLTGALLTLAPATFPSTTRPCQC